MLFTSYSFPIFIAILCGLYYAVPKKFQSVLLLAASYVFYFTAGPSYPIYIFATSLTSWYAALRMGANAEAQSIWLKEHGGDLGADGKKAYKESQKRLRFGWMLACLLFNLGILGLLKYGNSFIANVNGILAAAGSGSRLSFLGLAMPMGISFYTFQAISYVIDVNRGVCKAEKSLLRFALFVSFFPQLIQGPISRYPDLSESLYAEHRFDFRDFSFGLQRILWGYFKKLVVADRILPLVKTVTQDPENYGGAYALLAMLLYTIELYADFTGGIDITIGVARLFGIRIKDNFNLPYFSTSLKEYWRRWHISMCSWFRDYLFYPLSTSKPMTRFSKFARKRLGNAVGKRLPLYIASFTVWFATGLWHGASWNFIVWGLANWAVLMISQEFEGLYARFHKRFAFASGTAYRIFTVLRTFLLVCCLNIFDCYKTLAETFGAFASIFTTTNYSAFSDASMLKLGMSRADFIIVALGSAAMLIVSLLKLGGSLRERIAQKPLALRFCLWYALFIAIIIFGAYGEGYDASQFIYNQF